MLGIEFYTLSFKTRIAIIIIMTMSLLDVATTAWITISRPKYDLRTMALTRFAGGWPGVFIFSLLNILTQLACSVTVALAGAQALHTSMFIFTLLVDKTDLSSHSPRRCLIDCWDCHHFNPRHDTF